ncbi:MAG TPA: D-alanyl-D-alanine carboxypeptidase/D-alanyl-D-alanine-endopeptidase [Candidatus Eisenbacteria bacterium]|jgi:dihydroorotase/N-acyl-D-amino-acid deacylase|nr:D-alanyl-D-alanine carboxypeptidase/D-alanyl-D-alanine-endopeptidase [Candidatus Eisenbacteria bacterium]
MKTVNAIRLVVFGLTTILYACCPHEGYAQDRATLEQRVGRIMARPEFAHSRFGIKFISADRGEVIYELNSQQLFVPGSTTKLLSAGTALELLGADYRFHTKIYRTGPITKDGTLKGDLVLVASGDLNLSNRIQPDGTLAFEDEDHSYGGPDSKGLAGDPLQVIRELARQVAAKGIKKVKGRLLVDASLFPEGERELGTGVVISPVVVNDNVVDVVVSPGTAESAPAQIKIAPQTAYVSVINQATTGKADSKSSIKYENEKLNSDGTRSVALTGSIPLGGKPVMASYPVPEPSRYAVTVLAEALKAEGVTVALASPAESLDFKTLAAKYSAENVLAEHISLPLKEEVKVTLKVSQNLHASSIPYLLGALIAHKDQQIDQAGFDLEHEFLTKAGLDLRGAAQSDGAGGNAYFSPDFMVHYLSYMSNQKDYDYFYRALPILGKDGTLVKIQVNSPAAGHVHAKTGTYGAYDALNKKLMVTGKGLAGYMDTADGKHLILALYVNMVSVPLDDPEATQKIAGEALGEIAAAAYDAVPPSQPNASVSNDYDVIIKNGSIIDGSGNPWVSGDIAIRGDRIAAIGKLDDARAKRVIDATGLVVSPGFIDMLGQSEAALLIDNRSLSKLAQGITTEITGEGGSIAPQTELTLAALQPALDHYKLKVDWTTLDGYFQRLEKSGTPLNIGTYVGLGQVREAVLGDEDRAPTPAEMEKMKGLVDQAMRDGALGVSTALIYPPGHYAKTEELIELAKVASQYGGIYGTHMRSEGQTEPQAIAEALRIGREANLPVEIFHLKVSGKTRWGNMTKIVAQIQAARDAGQDVTANMYPYIAGGTALASSLPPWVADGGLEKLLQRLHEPATRAKIRLEMAADHPEWENIFFDSGGGDGVMVSGVENPDLKKFNGKTIAQIALAQKKSQMDTLFDFIIADKGQTGALYFMANENDLVYGLKQPWTSLCLDAGELSLDGPLYEPHTHPRAFGAMPRFLGHYVRDQKLIPLEQGIRKMTSLPAQRERLVGRGLLKEGYFADVTIFDPSTIEDVATYTASSQVSKGIKYVFVNGQLEFEDGKLTGVTSGRALRGPGWKKDSPLNHHVNAR